MLGMLSICIGMEMEENKVAISHTKRVEHVFSFLLFVRVSTVSSVRRQNRIWVMADLIKTSPSEIDLLSLLHTVCM